MIQYVRLIGGSTLSASVVYFLYWNSILYQSPELSFMHRIFVMHVSEESGGFVFIKTAVDKAGLKLTCISTIVFGNRFYLVESVGNGAFEPGCIQFYVGAIMGMVVRCIESQKVWSPA